MANTAPIRPKIVLTKVWTGVDSSTGQDISLTDPANEWKMCIYSTGTTTLVDKYVVTALIGNHTDAATMSNNNPVIFSIAGTGGKAFMNIKAVSGETVDIHCWALR